MNDQLAIPYPAWWIERADKRKRELDGAVDHLRRVVAMSPDIVGILVFGSYATNSVGPQSDLDLMLITTEAAGPDPGARYARFAARLGLRVTYDLIIYQAGEFDRLARERSFIAQARREGIWIDAATPA